MRSSAVPAVRVRPALPTVGLAIALCLALAGEALATPGGIEVTVGSGHLETLHADGVSRTVLEVTMTDPGHECWGGEVSGPGTFSLLVSAAGATVDPPMAVVREFPAQLTVTAGEESGTAEVKVQASWCPEDSVGAFGVCTDQSRAQSRCEAQIWIDIGGTAPPAEPPETDDEAVPALEATLGCAPERPVAGGTVSCSVGVQGARAGEQFVYVWYVDRGEMARGGSSAWSWASATAGAHHIGVDVVGDGRSLEKTVAVEVQAAAAGDDDGDGVPDDKDACRGQYGEGADGCPEPQTQPVAPDSSAGGGTTAQDPASGGAGEQPAAADAGREADGEVQADYWIVWQANNILGQLFVDPQSIMTADDCTCNWSCGGNCPPCVAVERAQVLGPYCTEAEAWAHLCSGIEDAGSYSIWSPCPYWVVFKGVKHTVSWSPWMACPAMGSDVEIPAPSCDMSATKPQPAPGVARPESSSPPAGGTGGDLSRLVTGGATAAPTAGRAAAAGAVAGGGLAAWLIAQILMDLFQTSPSAPAVTMPTATSPAGATAPGSMPTGSKLAAPPGPMVQRIYDRDEAKQILQDAGILQDLRRLKRDDPQYWEKVDKTLEKVKNDRRVKAITYRQDPGGIDEDGIVIVVEEPEHRPVPPPPVPPAPVTPPPAAPAPAASPPAAPKEAVKPTPPKVSKEVPPPDITTLREQRQKEVKDALERVRQLEELKKRLGEEYVRRRDNWEKTRFKGVTHGVVDVADLALDILMLANKPFSIMPKWYDGVGTSYSKSHFKNLLKEALDQVVNWRMGKPVKMDPNQLYVDPLGIKPMPGGALKNVLTNVSTRYLPGGEKISTGYSHFESGYSLGKGTRDKMALSADLRKQMQHFQGQYLATDAQLQEARDDLDTARKGLADVDRAIKELRQASPMFRNLGR
jgi:hypothetical protein